MAAWLDTENQEKSAEETQNIRKRAHAVAETLRRYVRSGIDSGEFKPGHRLPTERELMELFGGGRNIIRKTLVALEDEGLITRQVGSGTYISDTIEDKSPLPDQSSKHYLESVARSAGPFEVMELRCIIEPALAELAATRGSVNDSSRIRAAFETSLRAKSLKEFEDADDHFHRAIAQAGRNTLFDKVYDIVSVVRNETEWGILKERSLSPEMREVHSEEHGEILAAIEARDGDGAKAAMVAHLDNVKRMLFPRVM